MKKLLYVLLGLTAVFFLTKISVAAEHPGDHREHPGTTHAEEHPGKKALLSAEEIIKSIKAHIGEVTGKNNGYYPLYDPKDGKNLRLKLIRVHEDKVSYIKKDDAYFACTDFITDDGTAKYDVDFWMKKGADGKLGVYMTKIHKQDGKPRFTYQNDEIVPVE